MSILFYEDFEDALKIEDEWRYSGGHGSQGLTTEQIRYGSQSYKFSLTRYNSGDYREELALLAGFNDGEFHFTIGSEYWIGFSIFLAGGYYSNNWAIHHQYHSEPDGPPRCPVPEGVRNPIQALDVKNGVWHSFIQYDAQPCTPPPKVGVTTTNFWYDNFSTGQWHDFVINIKWSYNSDGFYKLWKDDILITNYAGGTAFNDAVGPYMKIGIYGELEQDQTMTVYYDELRIGDASSNYAEVLPGEGTGTPYTRRRGILQQKPSFNMVGGRFR